MTVRPQYLPAVEVPAALLRLRPRPVAAPVVLVRRTEVSASAWTGLHLDGVLRPLWRDTSRVGDVPESPALRASAVGHLVPPRGAVGQLAAVWVHAGGAAPERVTVLVRSAARRPEPHPDRVAAEADLTDNDVQELGGVLVTTLTRTAADVARWLAPSTAETALRALLRCGLDRDQALRRLDAQAGGRGVRGARDLLRRL